MKKYIVFFSFMAINIFAQEPADYYDKPVQEIREKSGICWDTAVIHKAGFRQCYREISRWISENRSKYDFLSVAFNKDSGVVQISLLSDCRSLRSGKVTDYYMILTSRSDSLKIAFENIRPLSKECRAGLRNLMKAEIVHKVAGLADSVWWNKNMGPSLGLVVTGQGEPVTHIDSISDRVFAAMKADSIRVGDSITRLIFRNDSIAIADSIALSQKETALDTAAIQKEIDSISAVVEADSIVVHRNDLVMFKNQSILKEKNLSIETRLECLEFLLAHKARSVLSVTEYLTSLKKYSADKQSLYYSVRKTIAAKDKFACTHYFKKSQGDCAHIQSLLDRLASR
jgi:hypothetical protein